MFLIIRLLNGDRDLFRLGFFRFWKSDCQDAVCVGGLDLVSDHGIRQADRAMKSPKPTL